MRLCVRGRCLPGGAIAVNRQHRALRFSHHALGNAADEEMREATAPVRAHHDDIGTDGLLRVQNRCRRLCDRRLQFVLHACQMGLGEFK